MQTLMREQVVLVTGASRGIGRAIALSFAVRGARLALAARGPQDLQQVVREAQTKQTRAVAFQADLSDRNVPVRLIRDVERELGEIDILINNAGQGSADSPRPVADFNVRPRRCNPLSGGHQEAAVGLHADPVRLIKSDCGGRQRGCGHDGSERLRPQACKPMFVV